MTQIQNTPKGKEQKGAPTTSVMEADVLLEKELREAEEAAAQEEQRKEEAHQAKLRAMTPDERQHAYRDLFESLVEEAREESYAHHKEQFEFDPYGEEREVCESEAAEMWLLEGEQPTARPNERQI
jgi:hypothetical protein